jgi:ATP-dependent protease ClpP protease subunit
MPSPDSTPASPPSSAFRVLAPGKWALVGELNYAETMDILQAISTTPPDTDILWFLETPGGLAHACLGIYQLLREFPCLETRAVGSVASAGAHLMQAGSLRTCYKHSQWFTHAVSCDIGEVTSASAEGIAAQFKVDLQHWVDVLVSRSKKKKSNFWIDFLSKDRFFSAAEALRLGLADKIIDA